MKFVPVMTSYSWFVIGKTDLMSLRDITIATSLRENNESREFRFEIGQSIMRTSGNFLQQ